mmetsp:Transcript_34774/g.92766  ORF Transcript_34774/g.92766 Transcript_34774/m.92766 type:complete len:302 (-) Transcript_34774:381-1286(-)
MQDVTIRRSLDRNNELFAMHSRQGRVMMEGIGTSMEAERKRAVQAVQRAARTVDPPPSKNPLDGFPMPHVWALVVTAVTCSICCVMMVVYAFDKCTFPNLMLSNYIIYYPANMLANISWPLYAVTHAYLEFLLWRRLVAKRSPAARIFGQTFLYVALPAWGAQLSCLIWGIEAYPMVHTVIGGVYGATWTIAHGIRSLHMDHMREDLRSGLAHGELARFCVNVRLICFWLECAFGPFIVIGMCMKELCPIWIAWVCCVSEHIFFVHYRLLLTTLSYIPDIMLLDEDLAVARAEKEKEWKIE